MRERWKEGGGIQVELEREDRTTEEEEKEGGGREVLRS